MGNNNGKNIMVCLTIPQDKLAIIDRACDEECSNRSSYLTRHGYINAKKVLSEVND